MKGSGAPAHEQIMNTANIGMKRSRTYTVLTGFSVQLLMPLAEKLASIMANGKKAAAYAAEMERSFLAAYDEHADALFRHCMLRIRDRDIAKDIVQETYTKTWNYLGKGKTIDHLRAFLYRVANNLIVDTSRRKRSSSLDVMMEDDGFEAVDETTKDPGEIGDARVAMKLLDALDDIYRTAVTMRYIDGLSPKEIAVALKLSENVVSVRIHRGIERLRSIVNSQGERA